MDTAAETYLLTRDTACQRTLHCSSPAYDANTSTVSPATSAGAGMIGNLRRNGRFKVHTQEWLVHIACSGLVVSQCMRRNGWFTTYAQAWLVDSS